MADSNTILAKLVRTDVPAGITTNFVANTGNSYHAYPVSTSLIGKMIERGALVYEQMSDTSEVLLTSETYMTSINGAIAVDSNTVIVPDFEQQLFDLHQAEWEEWLTNKGKEIQAKQTMIAFKFFDINEDKDSETVVVDTTDTNISTSEKTVNCTVDTTKTASENSFPIADWNGNGTVIVSSGNTTLTKNVDYNLVQVSNSTTIDGKTYESYYTVELLKFDNVTNDKVTITYQISTSS